MRWQRRATSTTVCLRYARPGRASVRGALCAHHTLPHHPTTQAGRVSRTPARMRKFACETFKWCGRLFGACRTLSVDRAWHTLCGVCSARARAVSDTILYSFARLVSLLYQSYTRALAHTLDCVCVYLWGYVYVQMCIDRRAHARAFAANREPTHSYP